MHVPAHTLSHTHRKTIQFPAVRSPPRLCHPLMDVPLIPISAAALIAKTSTCSRQEGEEEEEEGGGGGREWGGSGKTGETLKNRGGEM